MSRTAECLGFLLVAATAAGCGQADSGRDAKDAGPATLPSVTVSPTATPQLPTGGLTWAEPADPAAGRVYDICDDDQAIEVGLDGGKLDEERAGLGVTCDGGSTDLASRYNFVGYSGDVHVIENPQFDTQGNVVVDPGLFAQWMAPPRGGLTLGSVFDVASAPSPQGNGLVIVDGSTTNSNGVVRGLVYNATGSYQADVRVAVSSGGEEVGHAVVPFTMLAGESAAFEVTADAGGPVEISATGQPATAPPPSRAIAISGPGWWVPPAGGTVGDYDDTYPVDAALSTADAARAVYSAGLAAVTPIELGDPSLDTKANHPHLIVAALDDGGHVLDVAEVSLRGYGGGTATEVIDNDDPGSASAWSEFYVPQDVDGLALWAYGDGQ